MGKINNETYKKISVECAVCKTKFELWVSTANFTEELEKNIRQNFHRYCPVCKILKELEERQ